MRDIRTTLDATRRAIDDPTGAYTDIVAALESLGDESLASTATWDRYDSAKRKIIDAVLDDLDGDVAETVRAAVLQADRAGLKRRFVASTLARVGPSFYREEAVKTVRPPRSADLERMLSIAYDIRSRRSHVLEDLGGEAWVFTDGAETTYEARFERILTLPGLWRLTRHVVRRFVADAPKLQPEPWNYWDALPGLVQMQWAPRYWIGQAQGFDAETAPRWFEGVTEAMITWLSGDNEEGFDLTEVAEKIEDLVPLLPDGETKTTMVALHVLWHEWLPADEHRTSAVEFIENYGSCLDLPSPMAFAVGILSNRKRPFWTPDEWAVMALNRYAARREGKRQPLPPAIDALIQLEAADQLEAAGRHADAVVFAASAVEECPGNEQLMAWEEALRAGNHESQFNVHRFLFGESADSNAGDQTTGESTDQNRA
jgi:hypothetical protein